MKQFKGETAVITGAGSGIGRGIAISLAEAGMNIVVSDIEQSAANETCEILTSLSVVGGALV